jgi:hypothetical protein
MGYYVRAQGNITIADGQESSAFVALKRQIQGVDHGFKLDAAKTIVDLLEAVGFYVDPNDHKLSLEFDNKLWDEQSYIAALAPYCESGAITWQGEDHESWQQVITEGKIETRHGRVVYD